MVGKPKIGGREKGKSENLHLRFQQQQTSSLVCISNMCLTMFPLKSGSDETESSLRLRGSKGTTATHLNYESCLQLFGLQPNNMD